MSARDYQRWCDSRAANAYGAPTAPEPPASSGGGTASANVRSWAPATGTALEQRLAAQKARRASQRSAREPERRRRPPPPKPPPRPRGANETEQNDLDFGKGAKLLRLCGWTDGEGVGKNKQGMKIDAVLDATAALGTFDRRGIGRARGLGGWAPAPASEPVNSPSSIWAPKATWDAKPPDPTASGWGAAPPASTASGWGTAPPVAPLEPPPPGWAPTKTRAADPPDPQTSGWGSAPAAAREPAAPEAITSFVMHATTITQRECLARALLGCTSSGKQALSAVRAGSRMYLFNIQTNEARGPFIALGPASEDLVKDTFGGRFNFHVRIKASYNDRHPPAVAWVRGASDAVPAIGQWAPPAPSRGAASGGPPQALERRGDSPDFGPTRARFQLGDYQRWRDSRAANAHGSTNALKREAWTQMSDAERRAAVVAANRPSRPPPTAS